MSEGGWIGVDLDGTLAHYDKWVGEGIIGKPVPAMLERVKRWVKEGRDVRIFTARSSEPCLKAIRQWCLDYIGVELAITATKDFKMIELWDDRCIQVIPNRGKPLADLVDPDHYQFEKNGGFAGT